LATDMLAGHQGRYRRGFWPSFQENFDSK